MSCNNKIFIAWEIAFKIMTRSKEPLALTMLHPGGGQYECLAITLRERRNNLNSQVLINLHGISICAGDSPILINPYTELYEKDNDALLVEIARRCGYNLSDNPINTLTTMRFIIDLIAQDKANKLHISSTWHDGSDGAYLERAARDFSFYDLKNYTEDADFHMPWWTITSNNITIAMVNLETDELVTHTGKRYDLKVENCEAFLIIQSLIQHSEFNKVIEDTQKLLQNNPEWKQRYKSYVKEISDNIDFIKLVRKKFREWAPLKFYINVTNAKKSFKTGKFELRYLGQTVANLIYNGKIELDTKKYDKLNSRDFDCKQSLSNVNWDGSEAKKFRSHFKNRVQPRNVAKNKGNEEHRVESMFLTEFSKSKDKALSFIQPVKIANIRFPMPTPLSASNHKQVKYSKSYGGGIDILTRTGTGGRATNLCIMELKDENTKKEPPNDAIKQALTYATFIRELLRSDSGQEWWKLFGFSGNIPTKLVLFAACVMPSNVNNDKSFGGMELDINGDVIKLHYLYFTEQNNEIIKIDTSL